MCICINCRHLRYCITYQFIARQHNRKLESINQSSIFIPINTIVNVNLNHKLNIMIIDWDLVECSSFVEKPGNWLN